MNSPYSHKDEFFKSKVGGKKKKGQVTVNKVESKVRPGAQFYPWNGILQKQFNHHLQRNLAYVDFNSKNSFVLGRQRNIVENGIRIFPHCCISTL